MDTTQDTTQIAAELNKLPKPSSYNSLYLLAQQAFENGFRSMTINELVVYLSKNLPDDLTRSEFIYEKFAPGSTLPDPGREASVFLGAGTYATSDGELILTDNFNIVGWNGESWVKILELSIDVEGFIQEEDKQDSLDEDGTGTKIPTVDAVNSGIQSQIDNRLYSMLISSEYVTKNVTLFDSIGLPKEFTITWSDGKEGAVVLSNLDENVMEYKDKSATHPEYTVVYGTITYNEIGYVQSQLPTSITKL